MEKLITKKLVEVTSQFEKRLDSEIEKLDNLNIDDIALLRKKRLEEMKQEQLQKKKWLLLGHGEYSELGEEKQFFDACKKSEKFVCHFYKEGVERCKILDMHLKEISKKHIEARFVKLNAEKCPFLIKRLCIKVIPTLIITVDSQKKDIIIGFTDLGNCDNFSTEMLEWRIAQSNVINYNGDLTYPPDIKKIQKSTKKKKTIRENVNDSD